MGLRDLRIDAALTQDELAERAGISRATVVNIEAGRTMPYPGTIRKLADALRVSTRAVAHAIREDQAIAEKLAA